MLDVLIFAAHSIEKAKAAGAEGGKSMSLEWGVILIGVIVGLMITLMPPKRTTEFKKQAEE